MFDYEASMAEFVASGAQRNALAQIFLGGQPGVRRYLLGCNEHARSCMQWTTIDGVVDDFATTGTTWNGSPVLRANDLPKGAIVVNCSMSIRPVSAHARLSGVDGVKVLAYSDLIRAEARFPLPDFVSAFRSDYLNNKEKWAFVSSSLADARSASTLTALMLYRLTADYAHMSQFTVCFDQQYFDPVIRLSNAEVFVDCGGFDGDTALQFRSRIADYKRIYLFEPSPANLTKASARLSDLERLSLVPLGVSDAAGTLSFDPSAGSASAVNAAGSMTIDVVPIDDYISEPVTFIKMDLEGWELQALKGARKHIIADHPKLAIAVYHRPSDFWQIPEYVLGLRDDYDVYLRHYSEGWSETVMYFVPRTLN
jgi:FkbM family methyltransferase